MGKRTAYHRQYWRENREKRRAQKRESNARARARKLAAAAPKVFERCLRCRRRLKDKTARLIGYGPVCAMILFGPAATASQLDWIGYTKADVKSRHAALRAAARTSERRPVQVTR